MRLLLPLLLICGSLIAKPKILAFSGSTREGSFNQQLASQAAQLAEKMGANVTLINLKDYPCPFYNQDLEKEKGMPKNATAIRKLMIESDGIIIASPEYNGSLPAELKNLIDWTSRDPKGGPSREAYKGKIFAIMSTSPGGGGGKRALGHLETVLENVGATVLKKQTAIPQSHIYFSEKNRHLSQELQQEIGELMNTLTKTSK